MTRDSRTRRTSCPLLAIGAVLALLAPSTAQSARPVTVSSNGSIAATSRAAAAPVVPRHRQAGWAQVRGGRTVRVALRGAVQRGNTLLISMVWRGPSGPRLSDGRGDRFAAAVGPTVWGGGRYGARVYYVRPRAGGRVVVTARFERGVVVGRLYVDEYVDLDARHPVDVAGAGHGAGSTLRSPSVRTTSPGDLLYVAAASSGVIVRGSTGFRVRSTAFHGLVEDRLAGSTGRYRASGRQRGRSWVMQLVALRRARPPVPCALPAHPNASCTGVPARTVLSKYTGSCTVTRANTVIADKVVDCELDIQAGGVVVRDSLVHGRIILDTDLPGSQRWSLTLIDSEVAAPDEQLAAVSTGNLTVIRSNVHGGIYGVQCEEKSTFCTVRDSYLHGQYIQPGSDWHIGGFLSDGGRNMKLIHDYVVCDHPQTSIGGGCTGDINFIPNFAPISGALVQDNLLGANPDLAFCTYGGEKPSSSTPHSDHITYVGNVFQRGANGRCGAYGPVTSFNSAAPGNTWSRNRWNDGKPVLPDD